MITAVPPGPRMIPGTRRALSAHLFVVVVLRLFPGAGKDNQHCLYLGSKAAETFPVSSFSAKWVMSLIICLPLLFHFSFQEDSATFLTF